MELTPSYSEVIPTTFENVSYTELCNVFRPCYCRSGQRPSILLLGARLFVEGFPRQLLGTLLALGIPLSADGRVLLVAAFPIPLALLAPRLQQARRQGSAAGSSDSTAVHTILEKIVHQKARGHPDKAVGVAHSKSGAADLMTEVPRD